MPGTTRKLARRKAGSALALFAILLFAGAVHAQGFNFPADKFGGDLNQPCTWPSTGLNGNGLMQPISNIVLSSGTYTATVTSTAAMKTGQSVYPTGITDSFYNVTSSTSTGVTITVTSGTTFTYAGSGSHAASSGGYTAGNWYTQKVGSAIWQCDAAGYRIWLHAMEQWQFPSTGPVFVNKYGSNLTTSETAEINKFMNVGWNSFGANVSPTSATPAGGSCSGGCTALPLEVECVCDLYSSVNLNGDATQATPRFIAVHDANFVPKGDPGTDQTPDAFSPYFSQHLNAWMPTATSYIGPYLYMISVSNGIAAGPDFDSYPVGRTGTILGTRLLNTSPLQTGTMNAAYNGSMQIYPDPVIYSKVPMASTPPSCADTHASQCSLATLYQKEYSTIAAMNTAWGDTYGCFGTGASQWGYAYSWAGSGSGCGGSNHAAVAIGTGDGSTLSFTATLSANADPNSIQILLAGSAIGFDCPVFESGTGNGCSAGTAGTGQIDGTNLSGGTVTYASGAITVTFAAGHAPGIGVAITANFMAGGWGSGTVAGLMDEDGTNNHSANNVCVKNVVGTSGTDSYACRTGNGGSYANPTGVVNQTYAADIYTLTGEYYAKFFDVIRAATKPALPHVQLFSPDGTGNANEPALWVVYQAAQNYFDAAWPTVLPQSSADATTIFGYITTYYTGALYNETFLSPCNDSALAGTANCLITTATPASQAARGATYFTLQQQMLSTPGADGFTHWIGEEWWGAEDCTTDTGHNAWGIESCGGSSSLATANTLNLYDGVEAVSGTIACQAPSAAFTCGSEPTPLSPGVLPFSNGLTNTGGLQSANALWYSGTTPAPATQMFSNLTVNPLPAGTK